LIWAIAHFDLVHVLLACVWKQSRAEHTGRFRIFDRRLEIVENRLADVGLSREPVGSLG